MHQKHICVQMMKYMYGNVKDLATLDPFIQYIKMLYPFMNRAVRAESDIKRLKKMIDHGQHDQPLDHGQT